MAVELIQQDEKYEVSTEAEATKLIEDAKREYDLVKYSSTYKYKKSEDREYWIVELRKNFEQEV